MRQEQISNGYVYYPDYVCFAYNPLYIKFSGVYGAESAKIVFSNPRSRKSITINAAFIDRSADVYISKFLQLLVIDRSDIININVFVGTYLVEFNTLVVNGSLGIGERFGQIGSFSYDPEEKHFVRRVRWFRNFPFKVSVFADSISVKIYHRYDNNVYSGGDNVQDVGYNDYDPSLIDGVKDAKRLAVFKVTPSGKGIASSTFDTSFDYTFTNLLESVTIIRLNVDESKCGHYFRWIDPLGQLQYFLFTKGTKSTKVTDYDYYEEPVESNGMYFGLVKRTLEKTRTRELKCSAVNLTLEEQEYVETIVSSINCEMYLGVQNGNEIWMPVNVKAGSFSVSEIENLQDFEIVVELPISQTQTR